MADANVVIQKLGNQIGQLYVQLAIAQAELENSAEVVEESEK